MDKYKVSVFNFDYYQGSRILLCTAFSINPIDTLEGCIEWVKALDEKPDFIQISYKNASCLFDDEDTRIVNNIFYCNRH